MKLGDVKRCPVIRGNRHVRIGQFHPGIAYFKHSDDVKSAVTHINLTDPGRLTYNIHEDSQRNRFVIVPCYAHDPHRGCDYDKPLSEEHLKRLSLGAYRIYSKQRDVVEEETPFVGSDTEHMLARTFRSSVGNAFSDWVEAHKENIGERWYKTLTKEIKKQMKKPATISDTLAMCMWTFAMINEMGISAGMTASGPVIQNIPEGYNEQLTKKVLHLVSSCMSLQHLPTAFEGARAARFTSRGNLHPETFSNWLDRIKRKEATISPQGFSFLAKDRIYQDIMNAIEDKLAYGQKMKDPTDFNEFYLQGDVHDIGKYNMWKVPDSDRYTVFSPDYVEETINFWKDPDNISRAKILLSKIEDQVKGRTRYGLRAGMATERGHVLAWSNAAERWVLFQKEYLPGEDVYLDANYIFIPGHYEILDRVRWLIPDLPLFHMDWTDTMDLTFKERKEREKFR